MTVGYELTIELTEDYSLDVIEEALEPSEHGPCVVKVKMDERVTEFRTDIEGVLNLHSKLENDLKPFFPERYD
jgi:predicted transcriptional regulator